LLEKRQNWGRGGFVAIFQKMAKVGKRKRLSQVAVSYKKMGEMGRWEGLPWVARS